MDDRIKLLIALLAKEYRHSTEVGLEHLREVEAMELSSKDLAEIAEKHGGQSVLGMREGLETALEIVDEGVKALVEE